MKNCFISGGARGADTIYKSWAENAGHEIRIFRPEDINDADRKLYSVALKRANESLGRKYPTGNSYTNDLLLRTAKSIFRMAVPDSIHALCYMKGNEVLGGTAWGIQIFIDIMVYWKKTQDLPIYLYDLEAKQWKKHDVSEQVGEKILTCWKPIEPPDFPEGYWMGIGSRRIDYNFKLVEIYNGQNDK